MKSTFDIKESSEYPPFCLVSSAEINVNNASGKMAARAIDMDDGYFMYILIFRFGAKAIRTGGGDFAIAFDKEEDGKKAIDDFLDPLYLAKEMSRR